MKTHIEGTEASTGAMPEIGVKAKITGIERGKTAADAQYSPPNALQYRVDFEIAEPKKYKGAKVNAFFVIGTEDDPKAKEPETWHRGGDPAHLQRLFIKATDAKAPQDDDDWQDVLEGRTVCFHTQTSAKGYTNFKKRDSFFKEDDDDFVGIGQPCGTGDKKKAAPVKERKKPPVDEEEDEKPKKAVRKEEEEEEEKPRKRAAKGKKEEDEDED